MATLRRQLVSSDYSYTSSDSDVELSSSSSDKKHHSTSKSNDRSHDSSRSRAQSLESKAKSHRSTSSVSSTSSRRSRTTKTKVLDDAFRKKFPKCLFKERNRFFSLELDHSFLKDAVCGFSKFWSENVHDVDYFWKIGRKKSRGKYKYFYNYLTKMEVKIDSKDIKNIKSPQSVGTGSKIIETHLGAEHNIKGKSRSVNDRYRWEDSSDKDSDDSVKSGDSEDDEEAPYHICHEEEKVLVISGVGDILSQLRGKKSESKENASHSSKTVNRSNLPDKMNFQSYESSSEIVSNPRDIKNATVSSSTESNERSAVLAQGKHAYSDHGQRKSNSSLIKSRLLNTKELKQTKAKITINLSSKINSKRKSLEEWFSANIAKKTKVDITPKKAKKDVEGIVLSSDSASDTKNNQNTGSKQMSLTNESWAMPTSSNNWEKEVQLNKDSVYKINNSTEIETYKTNAEAFLKRVSSTQTKGGHGPTTAMFGRQSSNIKLPSHPGQTDFREINDVTDSMGTPMNPEAIPRVKAELGEDVSWFGESFEMNSFSRSCSTSFETIIPKIKTEFDEEIQSVRDPFEMNEIAESSFNSSIPHADVESRINPFGNINIKQENEIAFSNNSQYDDVASQVGSLADIKQENEIHFCSSPIAVAKTGINAFEKRVDIKQENELNFSDDFDCTIIKKEIHAYSDKYDATSGILYDSNENRIGVLFDIKDEEI